MELTHARARVAAPPVLATSLALWAAASCGARTEVLGAPPSRDAASEAPPHAPPDAAPPGPCADPTSRLIYAMGYTDVLYLFDPRLPAFERIGKIHCRGPSTGAPYSMAVDREGIAYVDYGGGTLYRIDTKTRACEPTTFDAPTAGFVTFEGAFAYVGGKDTLFGSGDTASGMMSDSILGTIDTDTLAWTLIGRYSPPLGFGETDNVVALTGTGDGRLFALSAAYSVSSMFIVQIDPATARLGKRYRLPGVKPSGGAIAFWGGDFYTFVGGVGPTVSRFSPATGQIHRLRASVEDDILVAGVSTCAPL